jgi:hypothetical protein
MLALRRPHVVSDGELSQPIDPAAVAIPSGDARQGFLSSYMAVPLVQLWRCWTGLC